MARRPRLLAPGVLYHVIVRGNRAGLDKKKRAASRRSMRRPSLSNHFTLELARLTNHDAEQLAGFGVDDACRYERVIGLKLADRY